MPAELVQVTSKDLARYRRALRALGPEWPKMLRKLNRRIAKKGESYARREAQSMGGVFAHDANAIKGIATATSAAVAVKPGAKTPAARATFWGADKRTGWNEDNEDSAPQFAPWVGNKWTAAKTGEGPYAINTALAEFIPELMDEWSDGLAELVHDAYPNQ